MDWPDTPLDQIDPRRFRPPHCTHRDCPAHQLTDPAQFRFHRHGSRKCNPRYRCLTCGGTFSMTAFSPAYYMKRPELLLPVAAMLNAGSAHRQIARSLGCNPSTVTRMVSRIARHCIMVQSHALENIERIHEPVVLDHFESFVFSQDTPVGLVTSVGQKSWFVYDQEPAPHRRAGTISPAQEKKQKRLYRRFGKPPRGEYARSTRASIDLLLSKSRDLLDLVTDDKPDYRRVVAKHPERWRIRHRIYRNPKRGPKGSRRSEEAKTRDNEMFAVDVYHGLKRHTCAHHKRETIAIGRRTNAMAERGFLMMVWRNFVKQRSERKHDRTTPAMLLGLTDRQWSWAKVFAKRLFPDRLKIPDHWTKVYRRDWITKTAGRNHRHRLTYAY